MEPHEIECWSVAHPRWAEVAGFDGGAARRVLEGVVAGEDGPGHVLVAQVEGRVVGLLGYLIQPIGPEMDVPVIEDADGRPLLEAKIRLFEVLEPFRNRGIGTALQREALRRAASQGCYQVRSRSELDRGANYAIKRKLGFAIHPAIRRFRDGSESAGVYWVRRL